MKQLLDLMMELGGGMLFLFSAGWVLAHISGYDAYYDKMLYDEDFTEEDGREASTDSLYYDIIEQLKQ